MSLKSRPRPAILLLSTLGLIWCCSVSSEKTDSGSKSPDAGTAGSSAASAGQSGQGTEQPGGASTGGAAAGSVAGEANDAGESGALNLPGAGGNGGVGGAELMGCTTEVGGAGGAQAFQFDSPEALLSDETVKAALAAVQVKYPDFVPDLADSPPDLTGSFVRTENTGAELASSDGSDVGRALAGAAWRNTLACTGVLESVGLSTIGGVEVLSSRSRAYVRGSASKYSVFSVAHATCTEQGSNFQYDAAAIEVGTFAASKATGRSLIVTLATSGTLTSACAGRLIGKTEVAGEWALLESTATRTGE